MVGMNIRASGDSQKEGCMGCCVLRLPENTRGRDFVVGDIHGAFDKVEAAMAKVGFDVERDRLLSVGDLVDRGAESAR